MSATNFQRLLALLAEAEVEFVVIGGLAATVHGSAYVTYDVDVCAEAAKIREQIVKRLRGEAGAVLRG